MARCLIFQNQCFLSEVVAALVTFRTILPFHAIRHVNDISLDLERFHLHGNFLEMNRILTIKHDN